MTRSLLARYFPNAEKGHAGQALTGHYRKQIMIHLNALGRLVVVGIILRVGSAQAAVIDNPAAGGTNAFAWEEPGQLSGVFDLGITDGISSEEGSSGWLLSVSEPALFGASVAAYNRPPTEFGLIIDGRVVPWTDATITREVISEENGIPLEVIHHFDGRLREYVLDAGSHFVTLSPSAFNTDGSTGIIEFSPLRSVPEPSAVSCIVVGLIGWWAGYRRTTRPVRRRPE